MPLADSRRYIWNLQNFGSLHLLHVHWYLYSYELFLTCSKMNVHRRRNNARKANSTLKTPKVKCVTLKRSFSAQ